MTVYGKDSWKTYEVYDIQRDVHGYPHFLIYEDRQWKYLSAKHFQPHTPNEKSEPPEGWSRPNRAEVKMKRVTYEYGCRALGYTDGEFYVDEDMSDDEIRQKIDDMAGFYVGFTSENGYEAQTEVVYRKIKL